MNDSQTEPSRGSPARSRLAGVYGPERPGLPRGRSSLPGDVVRRKQRTRILQAVIAAVGEKGFARTTVADVVARARVSRKAFYEHFTDLEDCLITATTRAERVVVNRLAGATTEMPPVTSPEEGLRLAMRAYLALAAREPEYTRCILIELAAAGDRALAARNLGYRQVADLLKVWREYAQESRPQLRPIQDELYLAAVGAVAELLVARLSDGAAETLPALEDVATETILRLLA